MIVEDNPLNMELVTDLLEKEGYDTIEANTAEDAIKYVKTEEPDLILMDIALPGMDGLTATKILIKEMGSDNVFIVALTASAMKGDKEKVLAAGCKGYISKPINIQSFVKEIAGFIEQRKSQKKITGQGGRILVVDDEEFNLEIINDRLVEQGYEVVLARNGEEALQKVHEFSVDLILLDIMMPKLDGYEVTRRLKKGNETKIIPIVMVTALKDVSNRVKALEAGADDFLVKPVEATELKARVKSLLKIKAYNDHMRNYQKELEGEVAQRTSQLREALSKIKSASLETVHRLSRAAEYKDEDTAAHLQRMSHYSVVIAKKMGMATDFVEGIRYASPMHDAGKIGIPDKILLKPGKLDQEEWEIMKEHAVIGAKILEGSNTQFIQMGELIALNHHERWDGSGYPNGLKGRHIPLAGRITAVADVFDALTSKRPYKKPFPLEKSMQIIKKCKGKHFDPEVVDSFFAASDEIVTIHKVIQNNKCPSLLFKTAERITAPS